MLLKKKEDPQHIGIIVEDILSECGYLSFCKEYGAMIKWEYIAGEKLGRVSRCERINAGILYVKVYASSWRQEAQYMKEKFLHRIHKDFGCSTIKDIVFY